MSSHILKKERSGGTVLVADNPAMRQVLPVALAEWSGKIQTTLIILKKAFHLGSSEEIKVKRPPQLLDNEEYSVKQNRKTKLRKIFMNFLFF